MDTVEKVFETIKNSPDALNACKLAEISGIDRKEVDKAMARLKADGRIVSPRRCYWTAK